MEGVVKICVTGAAGQIGYSVLPMIASGQLLGPDTHMILHLLDIEPCATALHGVVMELQDCSYPLLDEVREGTDPSEMLAGVDLVFFIGGFPRKAGMERKELMQKNSSIFKAQGSVLNEVAKPTTLSLVVANPANTNCLVLSHYAPNLPKKNFSAMTKLDQNRATAQVALKAGTLSTNVKNCIIWGNHSSTQYPDVNHGTVNGAGIRETIGDDAWLNGEFMTTVQKRGAAIIEARKLSSAMSAAKAAVDHMRNWIMGTAPGEYTSMGVISDGSYGIDEGLVYSFPVTCANKEWTIVPDLAIDDFSREKMDITKNELIEERTDAFSES